MKQALVIGLCFCLNILVAKDTFVESFENTTGGWENSPKVQIRKIAVADGAPLAAVTNGKSCLEILSDNGSKWTQVLVNKKLSEAIKKSDTLAFDLYVPNESLSEAGWGSFQVRLFGGNGGKASFDIMEKVDLDTKAKPGKLYKFRWNYASTPGFNKNFNWAQIGLVKVGKGGTMSPLYIDNMKLEKTAAGANNNITNSFVLNDEWELAWKDEFNGEKGVPPADHWLLGAQWNKDGTWRDATLSREESFLDGKGNLVMRTRYKGGKRLTPYLVTSEAGSYPKEKSITFGPGEHGTYIEWRINLSQFKAYAAWFAIWLFADNPYSGDPAKGSEIDIMEYIPFENKVYSLMNKFNAAVHLAKDGKKSVAPPRPYGFTEFDSSQWHTWGLLWTKEKQVFFLDGKQYWENTKYVSTNDSHGLRMSIEIDNGNPEKGNKNSWGYAVGQFEDNPKERLPSQAFIDYVRVYKRKAKK